MPAMKAILAQSLVAGFAHAEPDALLEQLITRHGIGGVILFARNIIDARQVWELNRELQLMARKSGHDPLFIMVDQEGGSVARLKAPFTHEPDFRALGAASESVLFAHGRQMGKELTAAGFNWNLAPVMDVHALADGVMASRSLGDRPETVAALALAYARGLASAGCLACAKHFPGLGRTSLDTHKLGVKVELSRQQLEQVELPPFVQAIAAHIPGIMVSHAAFQALDPATPASLSEKVVNGLLREHMGYQGLALTDDLEMGAVGMPPARAAALAYAAGNDLLLLCRDTEEILPALDNMLEMELSDRRVEQSRLRIARAKAGLYRQPSLADLNKILNI